jgi:hypothetical protein
MSPPAVVAGRDSSLMQGPSGHARVATLVVRREAGSTREIRTCALHQDATLEVVIRRLGPDDPVSLRAEPGPLWNHAWLLGEPSLGEPSPDPEVSACPTLHTKKAMLCFEVEEQLHNWDCLLTNCPRGADARRLDGRF